MTTDLQVYGPVKATRRERKRLNKRLLELFSKYDHPYSMPPLDRERISIDGDSCPTVFWFSEDASAIGVERNGEYVVFSRKTLHKMMRWYFGRWASEWFGLRRVIYYYLLRKECEWHNDVRL